MAKKKKLILIVEDDEVILRALYLSFHEGDFTIATATDGASALTMTQRMKPDLVLLDLVLPKMSGFDYLKDMKADPATKAIPVIVLSNLGVQDNKEKAMGLGAIDYFVKSDTDLSALVQKAKNILA
ncbi:MAG: response regulator [Candidatus Uhrbacteria bacterium]|nr:response regulator [Candidatus Uhrbacteria bacterium]